MEKEKVVEKLMYCKDFISKGKVLDYLNTTDIFSDFRKRYDKTSAKFSKNKEWDSVRLTVEVLANGVLEGELSRKELENLIFYLMEKSLLNVYLYKITSHNIVLSDSGVLPELLKRAGASERNTILASIPQSRQKSNQKSSFVVCAHRVVKNSEGDLNKFKFLILDDSLITIRKKNQDDTEEVYPMLVEFDFERNLVHIRLKDVDNIESSDQSVSTMSGRMDNVLEYVKLLLPNVEFEKLTGFKKSMYEVQEDVLSQRRAEAEELLNSFSEEVTSFVTQIHAKFPASLLQKSDREILNPKSLISYAVLSIISNTLDKNEIGDIVGIKFRNTREEEDNKYAEIYISDQGFRCISSHELYWNNLVVLQEQKKVESLKLVKSLASGIVISKLDFSLDTANVRILKRSNHPNEEARKQPNDEKYNEFIDYLLPFIQ